MTNLTTIANVKAYLGGSSWTPGMDALVTQLIARESQAIERWTGRSFSRAIKVAQRLNGTGTPRLVLPSSPVVSVESLAINDTLIQLVDSNMKAGFLFTDTCLFLTNQPFPMGYQNVVASWTSGYTGEESMTIPTGNTPVSLLPNASGRPIINISVVRDDTLTEMTEVSQNPQDGQYTFDKENGIYSFNSANSGVDVTMSYYCVPGPVEQACIEAIALDMVQRTGIGMTSKSIDGQSVSYTQGNLTSSAKQMLVEYRMMAPL